jgi:predicted AlkP superfamily phosphohydrolase/phosphomutase
MTEKPRVLVVGIDSADFNVTVKLMERGHLPNMKFLASTWFTRLTSTVPPNTAPSWTSMFTGVNPGKHGVFYFKDLDDGKLLSSADVHAPYVWEMFGSDARSAIVNVPLTFPVRPINGVMISGIHATMASPLSVFPTSLIPRVKEGYAFDMWDLEWARSIAIDYAQTLGKLLDGDRLRLKFFLELLAPKDWDFACIVLTSLDRIQHSYWKPELKAEGSEIPWPVERAYSFLDDLLGQVMKFAKQYNNVTLMVVSDHGFEEKRIVLYPNVYLKQAGLIKPKPTATILEGAITKAYGKALGILPKPLGIGLARAGRPLFNKLLSRSAELPPADFNSTYAYSYPYGLIRISKKTDADEVYETQPKKRVDLVKDFLSDNLYRDTGRRFRLVPASDLYMGDFLVKGPDLVLLPEDEVECSADFVKTSGNTPFGDHSMNGILLSGRPPLEDRRSPRVVDVATTILSLLGFVSPDWLDGEALIEPIPGLPNRRPISGRIQRIGFHAFTDMEEEAIKKRLKQLGYS